MNALSLICGSAFQSKWRSLWSFWMNVSRFFWVDWLWKMIPKSLLIEGLSFWKSRKCFLIWNLNGWSPEKTSLYICLQLALLHHSLCYFGFRALWFIGCSLRLAHTPKNNKLQTDCNRWADPHYFCSYLRFEDPVPMYVS